jgi:L-alanine-DL-glutamate epimerase-like enolase superfamily enzyme
MSLCRRVPNLRVAPHVNAEVHQHCAFASDTVGPIEVFPPDQQFDAVCAFISGASIRWLSPDAVVPRESPGLGMEVDWSCVTAHARWEAQVSLA